MRSQSSTAGLVSLLSAAACALTALRCSNQDPSPGGATDAEPDADSAESDLAPDVADQALQDADNDHGDTAPDPVDGTELADADAAHPAVCRPIGGEGSPISARINGWTVTANPADGAWTVARPDSDAVVLRGVPTCEEIAGEPLSSVRTAAGRPWAATQFGAFRIELESARAPMEWAWLAGAQPEVSTADDSLEIAWSESLGEDSHTTTLRFDPHGDVDLRVSLASDRVNANAGEIGFRCADGESFFGLGTQAVGLDLRGRRFPLWTQEQGIDKPDDGGIFPLNNIPEAAYAPMGAWHSSQGWSALVGWDGYSELDLCSESDTRGHLRSYGALPSFVLLAGETPRDRLTHMTDYTGRVIEPPPWVFAPWNDAVGGPGRLEEVASTLRDNDIPSSAIWSEDWIGGEQTATGFRLSYAWEWDPERYPDLPGLIADLHARGFAFLAYFNSFVPQPTRMWTEGTEGGFLVLREDGSTYNFQDPAFRNAGLLDTTNPAAVDWFLDYARRAAGDLGIDGWMADFAEWLPHDARLFSGESGWQRHNLYTLDWQRLNVRAFEETHDGSGDEPPHNWTFFARSGWASANGGTSGTAPTLWAGDQNTDWDYDDGFPTVIPIGVNAGLAGVAIYGSDVAGYTSVSAPNTTKELFFRWSSQAAFTPLMRTHHGSDECGNWSFDRDTETLAHYRRWATLHSLLLPYFQFLLSDAREAGLPLMRHPWIVEPNSPALWTGRDYLWFLGDDILVAPVLAQGETTRTVELPGRGWWPFFGSEPLRGEVDGPDGSGVVTATVDAPVTELPVFVRPGTAVPHLPAVVDSFYGATDADTTDLQDMEEEYCIALYPDADGLIRPAHAGAGVITGNGILADTDWRGASIGGVPLPICPEDVPEPTDCVASDGSVLHVSGTGFTVDVGSGFLQFFAEENQLYDIAIGRIAWKEWGNPTEVTNLDPDIPPPCEAD